MVVVRLAQGDRLVVRGYAKTRHKAKSWGKVRSVLHAAAY